MNTPARGLLLAGVVAITASCASAPRPEPTLQSGPEAEVSIDGLVRVDNPVVGVAFRKPDMDLTQYSRFMLDPVTVAYQKDPGNTRNSMGGMGDSNFALTPSQMERFRGWFQESVTEALTENDGYELTTEPGPDVMRIKAYLIDLVVRVPTQRMGRQDTYTRSYGEVSLILELYDSESGEVLLRAGDRRDPTRNTDSSLASVRPNFVRSDVERMFDHWSELLRERLDVFTGRADAGN